MEATRMWKVGIPSDPSASMGALISKAHLEKVSKSLQWESGEKLSAGHSTHSCFKMLLITTLCLKKFRPAGSGFWI